MSDIFVGGLVVVSASALAIALFERRARRRRGDVLRIVRTLQEREAALLESQEENLALAGRLIMVQETERRRIARDLHDDLSQKLALLAIDIEQLTGRQPVDRHHLERRLRLLSESVAEIASDVHDLSRELHPSKIETLGLVAALDALCRDVSHKYGVATDFTHNRSRPVRLEPDVSLHLYRIAQEALQNVVRHSGAAEALVELMVDAERLELHVADHGRGFSAEDARASGLGLVSMRERARLAGGQFVVHSAPGQGTRIGVRLPLDPPAEHADESSAMASRAEIA